ncbi:MAG TPA: hypothetical protein VLZ74_06125 [Methylocella sp.]|nr:hypothetical protein [Methylocella sp.]
MTARVIAHPVAQYLTEFGPLQPAEAATTHDKVACVREPELEDTAALLQVARDEGMAVALAEARAEYEAQLHQEQRTFETRLAAERAKWTSEESEKLSKGIKAIFAEIESNIAGSVARVLTPFVGDALCRRIIDLLAENVGALLEGGKPPIIGIHAPQDLLAGLREKLGTAAGVIDYYPEDVIDVRIIAGQTVIESQIEAWRERIKALPE